MAGNPLTIVAEALQSKLVRSELGERIIQGFELKQESKGANGVLSTIEYIFSGFGSLIGFICQSISGFVSWSWNGVWSWCVQAQSNVWNFNWNAPDDEMDKQIGAGFTQLCGTLGQTVGQVIGYTACGIVPGAIVFAMNEPLGTQILTNVSEKFAEQFLNNLGMLLTQALQLAINWLFVTTYKSVRKLLKSTSPFIKQYFGKNSLTNALDSWGAPNSKPWSFAIVQKKLEESIFGKEGAKALFGQQLVQQAQQSCIEAGYVVANTADTFLAAQALANQKVSPLGNETYVEITPNALDPTTKIVLGGSQEVLKGQIIQTLATNQQFNGRDLGVVYGELQGEIRERRYRPEVVLKFYRKQNKLKSKGAIVSALSMQISFRLMNKTVTDFATNTYLKHLATQIYEEFASTPYQIHKGTNTFTYSDFQNGYQFKLDVTNQGEAIRVIESILLIQGHSFNELHLRQGSKPVEKQTSPQELEINNKLVVLPLPNSSSGTVTFTHAYLNVGVNVAPINLVDITGKKRNVIYKPATVSSTNSH